MKGKLVGMVEKGGRERKNRKKEKRGGEKGREGKNERKEGERWK